MVSLKKEKKKKANHDYYSNDNYSKFNTDKNICVLLNH